MEVIARAAEQVSEHSTVIEEEEVK
jgi:hypothetical protein